MAKRKRAEEPYVLQVMEHGRWVEHGRMGWPGDLIFRANNLKKNGTQARVMHGAVEVGSAPGGVF